ncbi:MAG TPA: carboxy terminal-processing peptidase [Bacteroidales bacterium]|jgi:carboxyl-terminal processing protease|nr:carboxy terminal-processing peptidase [Bacteroidales bacterium]
MRLKKIIIIVIACFAAILITALSLQDSTRKEKVVIATIYEILKSFHYEPKNLDDSFSERMYTLYIKSLDYNKMYFTQEEISVLDTYKNQLDNQIQEGSLTFFELSLELINKQIKKIEEFYPVLLSKPFDYSISETIEIDEKKRDYAKNQEELYGYWAKFLKLQVMDEIIQIENEQKKAREKSDTVILKSFDEIEKIAREKIVKRYNTRFKRLNQTSRNDRFSAYVNALTGGFDPHTNYFPPKDKQDFDISISGKLEGIGATLSERDGYIKVVEIVPGSPSWKQGELKPEDIILKVAQGDNEPVDIVDMRLDEAVQLIRGPKGTKVVLTVKKIDGKIVRIPIIRDVIMLEEKYAKSAILTVENSKNPKVGYIYLPQFYTDMNDANGRRCSEDIKKEIRLLQNENVAGIILDLRDNGGGSLNDVVEIGGYFIEKGPIVQVNSTGNSRRVLSDYNANIEYDGPLVIIVNSFSASASEILAAAMQDYKRAVIVGTKSTYGKGTVQRFVDVDRLIENQYKDLLPLGAVKVTIQKFYRINGGSTQLKGVTPDVFLPDMYQAIELGEKELDYAMRWDVTQPEKYSTWKYQVDIKKIAKKSDMRIKNDSAFIKISESAQWLANKKNATSVSLQFNDYKAKQKQDLDLTEKYKNAGKDKTPLQIVPFSTISSTKDASIDSVLTKRTADWHKELIQDIELYETYRIMTDIIADYKK